MQPEITKIVSELTKGYLGLLRTRGCMDQTYVNAAPFFYFSFVRGMMRDADADQPLTCGDERRRGRGGVVCEVSGSVTLQSLFNVLFNQLSLCVAKKQCVCLPMID